MLISLCVIFVMCQLCKGFDNFTINNRFNIMQYITKHGYPAEAHANIRTQDGYLLDMFRIPHGKSNVTAKGPPVLLMHGLLGTAENWIILGPDKALAFLLADLGYDVWMGNVRGSPHSRKHTKYNPDRDSAYWQFSWHEIGVYDLPTQIDYVLYSTKQPQLYYIGHSQGTTSFFVMASERPEYNNKVKLMMALAPVAYMGTIPHPVFRTLSIIPGTLELVTSLIGMNEFKTTNEIMRMAGQAMCHTKAITKELCAHIVFLMCGYDSDQLDRNLIPTMLDTLANSAATKQLLHYAQLVNSGKFQHYDYGLGKNLIKYKSTGPPAYKLSNVKTPVALFYANNDWLSSKRDVEKLSRNLPNVVTKYLIPYKSFNHLDFIFAKNATGLLYTKMFGLL